MLRFEGYPEYRNLKFPYDIQEMNLSFESSWRYELFIFVPAYFWSVLAFRYDRVHQRDMSLEISSLFKFLVCKMCKNHFWWMIISLHCNWIATYALIMLLKEWCLKHAFIRISVLGWAVRPTGFLFLPPCWTPNFLQFLPLFTDWGSSLWKVGVNEPQNIQTVIGTTIPL
jgi:hypothetical protein